MKSGSLRDNLARALTLRGQRRQLRQRRPLNVIDAVQVEVAGRRLINFASNDYLGLSHQRALASAFACGVNDYGCGAGASALVTGYTSVHESAERAIASWKGCESAVLLPSGYQAAHAAVQTLAAANLAVGADVRFLADKLCHASLLDAIAATGRPLRVFPHNHLVKLRRLLHDSNPEQIQVVVTESIFSMDGDAADLRGMVKLKQDHPFALLLDEAHASGVYGEAGAGYAAELGLTEWVDVSIVTFSKALGCFGGAVCSSAAFSEAMANFGRAYIYTTSVPPAMADAVRVAIGLLSAEPQRQGRLRALASQVRISFGEAGLKIPLGDSPIIPIILGSEDAAIAASEELIQRGVYVAAIRPPTVPRGQSRLRITLSSEHSDQEVKQMVAAVCDVCHKAAAVPSPSKPTPATVCSRSA